MGWAGSWFGGIWPGALVAGVSSPGGIMDKGIMARDVAEGVLYGEWWLSGLMAVILTKAAHPTEPCPTQAVLHG